MGRTWVSLEVKAKEALEFCELFQQERGRPSAIRNVGRQGSTYENPEGTMMLLRMVLEVTRAMF